MRNPFRLGIIGTGRVSVDRHIPAALSSPDVILTALADTNLSRCRETADRFGVKARLAAAAADVLSDVDGVVIATPNHTHRNLAVECLQAGVHVLIEKPMATSVDDCRAIIEAARASGGVAAIGYSTRFDEKNRLMTELLASGFFGRIRRFAYAFGTAGGWAPVSGYNLDRAAVGGGVVAVSGSHFLDRMLQWFGYPDDIDYADDARGGPEANAVATLRFGSGTAVLEGHIRLSKTVVLESGLVLDTEEGMVVVPERLGAPIRLRPRRNPSLTMLIPYRPNAGGKVGVYRRQLENFVSACRQEGEPEVSGRQGLESVRLLQEMYARKAPLACDAYASLREGLPL